MFRETVGSCFCLNWMVESGSCHRQLNLLKQPKKRPPDGTSSRLFVFSKVSRPIREDWTESARCDKVRKEVTVEVKKSFFLARVGCNNHHHNTYTYFRPQSISLFETGQISINLLLMNTRVFQQTGMVTPTALCFQPSDRRKHRPCTISSGIRLID